MPTTPPPRLFLKATPISSEFRHLWQTATMTQDEYRAIHAWNSDEYKRICRYLRHPEEGALLLPGLREIISALDELTCRWPVGQTTHTFRGALFHEINVGDRLHDPCFVAVSTKLSVAVEFASKLHKAKDRFSTPTLFFLDLPPQQTALCLYCIPRGGIKEERELLLPRDLVFEVIETWQEAIGITGAKIQIDPTSRCKARPSRIMDWRENVRAARDLHKQYPDRRFFELHPEVVSVWDIVHDIPDLLKAKVYIAPTLLGIASIPESRSVMVTMVLSFAQEERPQWRTRMLSLHFHRSIAEDVIVAMGHAPDLHLRDVGGGMLEIKV